MASASASASASSSAGAGAGATVRPGMPNVVFGSNYGEDVNPSRWVVIYPPYIDSTRTEKEGRKIAKEKCVEKPTMTEIFDCVQLLGFQTALELDKAYCRDYWARGRIRIKLFDGEEKRATHESIKSRRALYARVAALIPEHRARTAAAAAAKGGSNKKANAQKGGDAGASSGKGGSAGGKGGKGGKGGAKVTVVAAKKKKKGKR